MLKIKSIKATHQGYHFMVCFLVAFVTLAITSKNSFLYPFNDWVDLQCFVTVGKAMMNGVVPYLELAEQKGPYVYLLYGFAWLVSPNSMFGCFLLEVIAGTFYLFFAYRIFSLYCKRYALVGVFALSVVTFRAVGFSHGGSVEELCLPLWAYAVFCLLRILREEPNLPLRRIAYLNGFFMGVVFFAKYTLLGLYIGVAFAIVVKYLCEKQFAKIFYVGWRVLAGFLVALIPWFFYFGYHHALADFYEWYFYNNLFLYAHGSSGVMRLFDVIYKLMVACWSDRVFEVFALLSCATLLVYTIRTKAFFTHVLLGVVMACAVFFVYVGGQDHVYCVLPLFVILLPGFGMLLCGCEKLIDLWWLDGVVAHGVLLVSTAVACYFMSGNVYLMQYGKMDLPQYQFAEIIQTSEHPTLLNYGWLDGGFYTAADVIPTEHAFCRLNVMMDEMTAEQLMYIQEQRVEFVVAMGGDAHQFDEYGYVMVAQSSFYLQGAMCDYQLFQLHV